MGVFYAEATFHTAVTTPGNFLKVGSSRDKPSNEGVPLSNVHSVEGEYWPAKLTLTPNSLQVHSDSVNPNDVNGVVVGNASKQAMVGMFEAPGYFLSKDFSGCVFYLYRIGSRLFGAHAERSSGHFADPQQYIRDQGGTLLYFFDSVGRATSPNKGAAIVSASQHELNIYFIEYSDQGNPQGATIVGVLSHEKIPYWGSEYGIPFPNLPGGCIGSGNTQVQVAEKPKGFRRVQKTLQKYI
jgi:hypothetical protein